MLTSHSEVMAIITLHCVVEALQPSSDLVLPNVLVPTISIHRSHPPISQFEQ